MKTVSRTIENLLFAEDWFIWLRDGDRVRRFCAETWHEWLEVAPIDEVCDGRGPHVLAMLPYCKNHSSVCEKNRDGSFMTPTEFLRGLQ